MFGAAGMLVPLAVALAIFGAISPSAIPLCFYPQEKQKIVCPTEEVHLTPADAKLPAAAVRSTSTRT